MKFVFLNYGKNPAFNKPEDWIYRIRGYTGILESMSKENKVVSIEQINYHGLFAQNSVEYHFLRFHSWESFFPFRLHRYVKKLGPDIVVVHGMHFPLQVIQLRKMLNKKTKIIVQNHAEQPGSSRKIFLQRIADASIDAYLFTAVQMGEAWINKDIIHTRKKIYEVMEASSVFSPMKKKDARDFTKVSGDTIFLWVGRLDENKDPLTVVKSFLQFAIHRPGTRLYMIFHTEELMSEIKRVMVESMVQDQPVVFVGKVDHDKMQYWYNSADFIISGSHYEGSGVAVCEAMSCGCIPIVTNILSFSKITNNGQCGLLYEPGDAQSLLSVLEKSGELNREEERRKVLEQFQSYLSFEAIASSIQEIAGSL